MRCGRSHAVAVFCAAGVLAVAAGRCAAQEPIDLVPEESLLCWYGRPDPAAASATTPSLTTQALLELSARLVGTLPDNLAQLRLRAGELLNVTLRHPHALALIDAQAAPVQTDPQARRVDRLRVVLVARLSRDERGGTAGDLAGFMRIIQKTVNEQTHGGEATLTTRDANGRAYQELRDRRLPEWASIAWGTIDDFFVLTIGQDVWPKIAQTASRERASLSADAWYAAARLPRRDAAMVEVFVNVADMLRRLDPFVEGRTRAFFAAWGAEDVQRAHWLLGFEGRAMLCVAHFQMPEETLQRWYANPRVGDPRLLAAIPEEARYAVFQVPMGRYLPRIVNGFLATQGERTRDLLKQTWSEFEAAQQFDTQRDLLDHLGPHVVMHDSPPHPLRLPLAVTTLIEIRDAPDVVRRTIDTMCRACADRLDAPARRGAAPFTLHQDADGIWYVRFQVSGVEWIGLAGPAWTVTERFIVLSWSPAALREYLARAGAALSR